MCVLLLFFFTRYARTHGYVSLHAYVCVCLSVCAHTRERYSRVCIGERTVARVVSVQKNRVGRAVGQPSSRCEESLCFSCARPFLFLSLSLLISLLISSSPSPLPPYLSLSFSIWLRDFLPPLAIFVLFYHLSLSRFSLAL